MQSTVATLLLVTSAVMLCCFVVNYAITVSEQTIQTEDNPQLDRLRTLEELLLNQTSQLLNQTQIGIPNGVLP
ncbi:MAG: hypothetical protein NWF01_11380 [Candidatus Bathyarchaeota archaeon]|nr:hypothetical protein [Candidatus Bathyarchaeota archaeon]